VLGGGAADIVKGGDGDDILYGGAMVDRLECGAGNDLAVVESALEGNIARSLGCEAVVTGDPSVSDPNFDGLFGTPHPGKTTGGEG
jgi:Ca2+-binding RTX toxin-like protein